MLRFYLSTEYRKMYNQLTNMELLNDSMTIRLPQYQSYFHHLVIVDPGISKQIQLFAKEKLTPIKCVKIVIFMHTWLQSTCVVEDADSVLEFINSLFRQIAALAQKAKEQASTVQIKQLSKSAVLRAMVNNQQLQVNKELFILQEVLPAYLYYLQKLVSIFDFYNSLKKNFIRSMNPSEIWVLVNLLRCGLKVTNCIPSICKFVKKSYRPITEAIAYAFIQDVNYFYPKLYKYCYGEAAKLRASFGYLQSKWGEEEAFRKTGQSVEFMANLLDQVQQINKSLKLVIQEPIVQQLDNLYPPKLIDVVGQQFQMVLQLTHLKKGGYPSHLNGYLATPKFEFLQSSKSTLKTEQKEEEQVEVNLSIFRDMSNENDQGVTFRKEKNQEKGMGKLQADSIKEDEIKYTC